VKKIGWIAAAGAALLLVAGSLSALPASAGNRAGPAVSTVSVTESAARVTPRPAAMTCPVTTPSFCSEPGPGNVVKVRVATGRSFALVTGVRVSARVYGLASGAMVLLGSGVVGTADLHAGRVTWDLSTAHGNSQDDLDLFAHNGSVDLFVTPGRANAIASVRVAQVSFTVTGRLL